MSGHEDVEARGDHGGYRGGDRARLAVFVSGSGRTLENLLGEIGGGRLAAEVGVVVASRECRGAEIGRAAGIETVVVDRFEDAGVVHAFLEERGIEWVVLAGYVKYLPVPDGYAGRIVNIHPALLPKFGGRGMYGERVHRAVLGAGETESGCTVHLVDGEYDRGMVLAQERCRVEAGDTPETLGARVFELEKRLYPMVLAGLIAGAKGAGR